MHSDTVAINAFIVNYLSVLKELNPVIPNVEISKLLNLEVTNLAVGCMQNSQFRVYFQIYFSV